jgi:NhaP-type Na+/H+ or K+/H+ antiporter
VTNLFVAPTFAFFGAVLPFAGWSEIGIAGLLFAVVVLAVRRPPAVAAALAGSDVPRRDRAFLGWFGPLGVAAIYYATLAETYDIPEKETVFAATTLAVVVSVVAHGVTATPAVLRYAGRRATHTLRRPLADDPR